MNGTTTNGRDLLERVRLTVAERRLELGVSAAMLARAARVHRQTIRKIEAGEGCVDPAIVLAVSSALTELELHAPPQPTLDPFDALFPVFDKRLAAGRAS
jgi:DNA-binding XRE family transcriptional regulator